MKNKFILPCILTLGFLLLGAGCSTATNTTVNITNIQPAVETNVSDTSTQPTETKKTWRLSFDLPEGWIMTEGCELNGQKVRCDEGLVTNEDPNNVPKLDLNIDPKAESITIQNTDMLPLFGGIAPYVNGVYKNEDVAVISVSHVLDKITGQPNYGLKTEDLGNGFYKVITCDLETYPECAIYGNPSFDYYFVASSGEQYKFVFRDTSGSKDLIEKIILSAKE